MKERETIPVVLVTKAHSKKKKQDWKKNGKKSFCSHCAEQRRRRRTRHERHGDRAGPSRRRGAPEGSRAWIRPCVQPRLTDSGLALRPSVTCRPTEFPEKWQAERWDHHGHLESRVVNSLAREQSRLLCLSPGFVSQERATIKTRAQRRQWLGRPRGCRASFSPSSFGQSFYSPSGQRVEWMVGAPHQKKARRMFSALRRKGGHSPQSSVDLSSVSPAQRQVIGLALLVWRDGRVGCSVWWRGWWGGLFLFCQHCLL